EANAAIEEEELKMIGIAEAGAEGEREEVPLTDLLRELEGSDLLRELEEETGYRAGTMDSLGVRYTIPGMSAQPMHFFLAGELEPGEQRLEATEHLDVHELELETLVAELLGRASGEKRIGDN
ncbi:MAG: hypothetical protein MK133_14225, partial [Planctomycetes bacterium]|nr:hypothetical protein [Planctomycetota bacterium]